MRSMVGLLPLCAVTVYDGGLIEKYPELGDRFRRFLEARPELRAFIHDPVKRGGTGRTIDWTAAADLAARRRVLLAGGLTPDNVADAISRVRPFGIDVSSGVERAPGVKDHQRLRALFEAVHATGHLTTRS